MILDKSEAHLGNQYYGRAKDIDALFTFCRDDAVALGDEDAIDADLGTYFTKTIEADTTLTVTNVGTGKLTLKLTSTDDLTGFVTTFGSGFKSQGTLNMGTADAKVFIVEFVSNGTNYCEVSRTAAM
jgi:hypothetical protein